MLPFFIFSNIYRLLFLSFDKKRLNLPIQKDLRINGYYIYTIDGSCYDC
jgi:hypothetical protein